MMQYLRMSSPVGLMTLTASENALISVSWGDDDTATVNANSRSNPILTAAVTQLDEYFRRKRTTFDLPLEPRGTDFQKRVWRELLKIPFGESISYGEQANRLGQPLAARAVGAANGKNPIGIIIPCHRVVGATGALTGFAGGLPIKRLLLDHEGAQGCLLP